MAAHPRRGRQTPSRHARTDPVRDCGLTEQPARLRGDEAAGATVHDEPGVASGTGVQGYRRAARLAREPDPIVDRPTQLSDEHGCAVGRTASEEAVLNSNPALAVEASGLVKAFGKTLAVDGVNLAVPTGMVYGFLGPNGAGKTTTIRILATLLRPDAGMARVLGHDVVREADAVRGRVSLTGQLASVDEDLTGLENLILLARLLGHSRVPARVRAGELLDAFGLAQAASRLVKTWSGGMRRRLDLAASIVVTPELLFLDEPTTGLDPRSRQQLWEIVRALVAGGTTVLLTTQYLNEADQLADRVAVIDHGKVIAEGAPSQLKASVGAGALRVRLGDPHHRPEAERLLAQALGVPVHPEPDPAALSAPAADPERAARALAELSRSGVAVSDFSLSQPSLDEVFLALTGRPADNDHAAEEDAA
jgi:ABC-2 type transport system ATP-binding protein